MNTSRLNDIISNPALIDNSDLQGLKGLVNDYPYYQIAHVLLLSLYHKYDSETFDVQLRESAIHIPDRRKLYNLLFQYPAEKYLTTSNNHVASYIDEPVEFQFGDIKPEITIDEPADKSTVSLNEAKQELLEIEEVQNPSVVESENDEPDSSQSSVKDFSLIDKFIDENPAFVPNKLDMNEKREDISVNSVQEDDSLVTETLAQIFEMQKLYEKAITVYEKLILKFPEKSTYFANRINELKLNIK